MVKASVPYITKAPDLLVQLLYPTGDIVLLISTIKSTQLYTFGCNFPTLSRKN